VRSQASYTPHVTMLYDDVTAAPQSVAPVEWTVRELVLLHSHIDQGRPYTILAGQQSGVRSYTAWSVASVTVGFV
jgi:2'-5' RNA ligase